jgi:hypothetical protein
MLALASSLAGTTPLIQADTTSVIAVSLVVGAVAPVFWTSRPSVVAGYSVKPSAGDAPAESAEKEPRA